MSWLSQPTSFHPKWFRETSEGSVLISHQRIPVVVTLVFHGSWGGMSSLGSGANPTIQQSCSWGHPVPGAKCSLQTSAEQGFGKGVVLGSLKAEQEPVSPPWCGQLDVTKTGSWQWQHEHFPSLWQQPIFVLFKNDYPANTLIVMPWYAPFSGLIWSNRLLRHWDMWTASSCGACPAVSFFIACRAV